jgi:hypothetical protein
MTPLEQTFWCERFQYYFHRQEPDGNTVPDIRHFALHNADLDLEEFRKRFGGGEVKADKLDTAIDLLDRNNHTPKTTLYPWELLPEWVMACATDQDGISNGYNHIPVIDSLTKDQWAYGKKVEGVKLQHDSFSDLGLENIPVPNWRTSLEARPKK